MNRITYIALCMLASCVASTSLAASASAGEPAWWECARAAKVGRKFTGRYTNRNCSSEATQREIEEGKTNKYEFREWDKAPGEVKAFKGKGGSVDLEERGVGGITCEANSNTGEVTGPETVGNVVVHFSGCYLNHAPCQSKGAKTGEMVTNKLNGELGYINSSEHRVGEDMTAAPPNLYLIEFYCSELNVRVGGSVISEVARSAYNKFSKSVTLIFNAPAGRQEVQNFEGFPKDTMLGENCDYCEPQGNQVESSGAGEVTNRGEELYLKA